MEVADRLSLKGDLEIARDIQLAMLPGGIAAAGRRRRLRRDASGQHGRRRFLRHPAALPDGRIVLALGDVAGKGSPAALLMALLLAMLRTLVDEGLETSRLLERLNVQVARHARRRDSSRSSTASTIRATDAAVRERRSPSAARAPRGRTVRTNRRRGRRRTRARHVRERDLHAAARVSSRRATCSCSTATASPKPRTRRAALRRVRSRDRHLRQRRQGTGSTSDERCSTRRSHAGDARLGDDLTALVLKRAVPIP